MAPIGSSETSGTNYKSTLRKIRQKQRFYLFICLFAYLLKHVIDGSENTASNVKITGHDKS
jgi:hypothetical protein